MAVGESGRVSDLFLMYSIADEAIFDRCLGQTFVFGTLKHGGFVFRVLIRRH